MVLPCIVPPAFPQGTFPVVSPNNGAQYPFTRIGESSSVFTSFEAPSGIGVNTFLTDWAGSDGKLLSDSELRFWRMLYILQIWGTLFQTNEYDLPGPSLVFGGATVELPSSVFA